VTTEATTSKDTILPPPAGAAALSDINAPSLRRFFIVTAAVATLMVAAAWVWAIHGRMWFLDPEYPMWLAKNEMIEACDVGDTVILGDSRAMAGLVPALISPTTVNLAVGGATPIESERIAERIAKCPTPPKRVLLSFQAPYMMVEQAYWERTALFHYLGFERMEALRKTSLELQDSIVYSKRPFESFLEIFKNYGYSISFPSFYFPAMVNAGFIGRKEKNEQFLQTTRSNRGQHFFGTADRSDWFSSEAEMTKFHPSPVLDVYFDRMISALRERGIKVYFAGAPLNQATYERVDPKIMSSFLDYLKDKEAKDPNFRILASPLFSLPNEDFGDVEHLNPKGAASWSKTIAELLKEAISQERKVSAQQ
jgi:hypothetical protein